MLARFCAHLLVIASAVSSSAWAGPLVPEDRKFVPQQCSSGRAPTSTTDAAPAAPPPPPPPPR